MTDYGTYPCGCPKSPGKRIHDVDRHLAFHALVVEQGGPEGVVDFASVRAMRGQTHQAPDMHKVHEKHVRLGKSSQRGTGTGRRVR